MSATVITSDRAKEIIMDVIKDFGTSILVEEGETPPNHSSGIWKEHVINIKTATAGENFEDSFRARFSEQLEIYRAEIDLEYEYQNPRLKTKNPIYTYRMPDVMAVTDSACLISVLVGFPFACRPYLPRTDL